MKTTTVLVTGGTGYLASWIVKELLEQGHHVRITVRDKQKKNKYEHLLEIEQQSAGSLFVYEADLLKQGSFDEAAEGCEYVFHTASPFFISGITNAYEDLVKPALEGTRNVLGSVNRTESVKRVVLTSSVVAMYGDNADIQPGTPVNEQCWNDTSSEEHQPYSYSKMIAEKEAWNIAAQQERWDLVTINPTFLLGPSLAKRNDSTSISTILDFLKGKFKTGVPNLMMGIVDVRDVAKAHVSAAFHEQASGRYLVSGEEATFLKIASILEQASPGAYPLPKREVPKPLIWLIAPTVGLTRKYVSKNVGHPIAFNAGKSRQDLGLEYRNLKSTIVDQKNQLEQDQLI
jgi:nucleoside-diphosphate-sugar epimerase